MFTKYFYYGNNCYIVKSVKILEDKEIDLLGDLICNKTKNSTENPTKNQNILLHITDIRIGNYLSKIEIGPLTNFNSPWCSNAVSILRKCGNKNIQSIEETHFIASSPSSPTQTNVLPTPISPQYDTMTECVYDQNTTRHSNYFKKDDFFLNRKNMNKYSNKYSYGFDKYDIKNYTEVFDKYKRDPTNVELFDLAQSNSEHSRHWSFNSILYNKDKIFDKTLFNLVKDTLNSSNNRNSVLAFCDNSSAIYGYRLRNLVVSNGEYKISNNTLHPVLTAETHNFPTGIAPFPGAATGVGGRIRDNLAVGRGGLLIAGTAGYSIGNLHLDNDNQTQESNTSGLSVNFKSATEILISASNGASDYGNKFGEPIIAGFTRSFGIRVDTDGGRFTQYEYVKPIMFTAGIGQMRDKHKYKDKLEFGFLIVRVGGPVYRIGMGGGTASSRNHDSNNKDLDRNAVQRGDPEMENRVYKFIRACIELGDRNPIVSIHDQGAGGMANVTKEIIEPNGGLVCINNVILGDNTLSTSEIWSSEHQEQLTIIIHPKDIACVKTIAKRENVPICFFGYITDTGKIEVYDKDNNLTYFPVNLDLKDFSSSSINKSYNLHNIPRNLQKLIIPYGAELTNKIRDVLRLVTVGSKRFLTNKVDRSVSGLIAQQQCIGPFHTPLSNVAVVASSHFDIRGIASSIGECPIVSIIDNGAMVRLTVAEMITNLMWVEVSSFTDIKCSGNWMWALKGNCGEFNNLHEAVRELSTFLIELGIGIDGGKDSLSMSVKTKNILIKSPNTLVMTSYVATPNILNIITPDFKAPGNYILFVDMSGGKNRLGGSAFAQTLKQVGNQCPDITDATMLRQVFQVVQGLIKKDLILAGHDRSDGGLVTTLIEMCISSNIGCDIGIDRDERISIFNYLFSEEVGIVLEIAPCNINAVETVFQNIVPVYRLGKTTEDQTIIINDGDKKYELPVKEMRKVWEETSYRLELLQADNKCVEEERENIINCSRPQVILTEEIIRLCELQTSPPLMISTSQTPVVAILREEGSNGEREMAAAFYSVGFKVLDITMNDLVSSKTDMLENCRGLVFVGGFTYSDVFGAGVGWYNVIKHNDKIRHQFARFYNRKDTFSLGVCNGCQLMSLLGWIPGKCRFKQNKSKRFESRFSTVKIRKSPAIMLSGLEDCSLGIWVAHGEGQLEIENPPDNFFTELTPIQYVDENNEATERYPMNPNGSVDGITAVCSEDGRHLAMMPHPERCFMNWQLPWAPSNYPLDMSKNTYSPWIIMFYNAYQWSAKH